MFELFNGDFGLDFNFDPAIFKKVGVYEGIPFYATKAGFPDKVAGCGAVYLCKALSIALSVAVSRRFANIKDNEIRNWILAHEFGHVAKGHGAQRQLFLTDTIIADRVIKSPGNYKSWVKEKHAEQFRTHCWSAEYEADLHAARKYGVRVSEKALVEEAKLLSFATSSTLEHPSIAERIKNIKEEAAKPDSDIPEDCPSEIGKPDFKILDDAFFRGEYANKADALTDDEKGMEPSDIILGRLFPSAEERDGIDIPCFIV